MAKCECMINGRMQAAELVKENARTVLVRVMGRRKITTFFYEWYMRRRKFRFEPVEKIIKRHKVKHRVAIVSEARAVA